MPKQISKEKQFQRFDRVSSYLLPTCISKIQEEEKILGTIISSFFG
jgi:hypothetical protein